jgi:hypothetical protein
MGWLKYSVIKPARGISAPCGGLLSSSAGGKARWVAVGWGNGVGDIVAEGAGATGLRKEGIEQAALNTIESNRITAA